MYMKSILVNNFVVLQSSPIQGCKYVDVFMLLLYSKSYL